MLALAASTNGAAMAMGALAPRGALSTALFQLPTFETLVTFGVMMGWLMTRGHYLQRIPTMAEGRDLVAGGVIAGALTLLLTAHADGARVLLAGLALQWALLVPMLVGFRLLARYGLSQVGLWQINAVLVGTPAATERVSEALAADPSLGYSVVGRLRPELVVDLQRPGDWRRVLAGRQAEVVVFAEMPRADADLAIAALARAGVQVAFAAPAGLPVHWQAAHHTLRHDVALATGTHPGSQAARQLLKVVCDRAVALVLLISAAPALLGIAAIIRLSGSPVLFSHQRIGQRGELFGCLKFRTMRVDGDRILADLLARDPAARMEWEGRRKLDRDPRITPIGRLLRKTSLDELPQLLNVLRGDMSLVGPRPIVTAEAERYADAILDYTAVRPGLTGLWQVSGRSNTSYEERVALDTWYVRNWSLTTDLAILLRTIPALVFKKGAV